VDFRMLLIVVVVLGNYAISILRDIKREITELRKQFEELNLNLRP
jgi:uracil-DNA glycosylase